SERLVLRYEQTNQPPAYSIGVDTSRGATVTGLGFTTAWIPWSMSSIFLTSGAPSTDEDVKHFGELEAAKRQEEILPALKVLEPRLRGLSLVPFASETVIQGNIENLPRLVPV